MGKSATDNVKQPLEDWSPFLLSFRINHSEDYILAFRDHYGKDPDNKFYLYFCCPGHRLEYVCALHEDLGDYLVDLYACDLDMSMKYSH